MPKGRFSGAKEAKISNSGTKCSDGRHLLRIKRLTWSDGKNGDYYVGEFDVVKSGNPADPEGSERVWTQSMDKKAFPLGKLKAFAFAAMGYDIKKPADAKEITDAIEPEIEDILEKTQDESDPLGFVGRLVWATVKTSPGKSIDPATNKPFPFAQYTFTPGDEKKLGAD